MAIDRIDVKCFKIPTATPEVDGTLEWNATNLVTVEVFSGRNCGLGYTYADRATAEYIVEHLLLLLKGKDEKDNFYLFDSIKRTNRNFGNSGVAAMALSALDIALWDLKAHRLNISIQDLLGKRRKVTPFYGSGLFINNTQEEIQDQISKFRSYGINIFKMKIGEGFEKDCERVRMVRGLVGKEAKLYVDANGYYRPKDALKLSVELDNLDVTWFEEPVSSDDINGMKLLRNNFPPSVNLVSGEYCYQSQDVQRLIQNECVDILMVDATRCEGVTGTIRAAHLAREFNIPLSTHCAPLVSGNLGVCLDSLRIAECFYDHLRIEESHFEYEGNYHDGNYEPSEGQVGFGWKLKTNLRENLIYEHTTS